MMNVTWQHFNQSAKQLIVGHTTNDNDGASRFTSAAVTQWKVDGVSCQWRLESLCVSQWRWRVLTFISRWTQVHNSSQLTPDTSRKMYSHMRLTALYPRLPGWAGTRKVKPISILLKQETVSWAVCKSAPRSRQITTTAPNHRPDALPAIQPTVLKHWRQKCTVIQTIWQAHPHPKVNPMV